CHHPYDGVPMFWCPRCGTLKANVVSQNQPPSLPARVRKFLELISNDARYTAEALERHESLRGHAHRIGLYESCMPESERP
ncbi:MAG: hypothetical protein ACYTBZ_26365, partial [Planctomycetota bacterium]